MNLTLETARAMIQAGWRPMPGRSFIHLDPAPAKIGAIHIPESAQGMRITNTAWSGTVLATTFKDESSFDVGDRVWFLLYEEDLGKEVIITRNETICAVVNAPR